jgi:PAS domain S-box-containing protein
VLEWSNETYRIFGIPIGTPMNDALFMQQVHPEDRELLHENWEAGIKNGIYEGEHRIITPSGEKWVREMARMQYDPSGKLIAALGTVQDISEKKQTEGTIRESETLYKNLFNNSPFPNGILEKNTLRFLEVNDTATRTYGYTREEFLQLTAYDIRVPEEHERLRREVEAGEYASDKRIRAHRKKNGEIILIEPTITEILYKGNSCFLITINDVTEKMKIQDELIRTRINQQKEINRASIEAQENNRAEIGRELHDNVNQLLVASNLYLKNVHVENERDRALIEKSLGILNTAISEIRKLSWSLVPPSLDDLSLKDAIEELAHLLKLSGSVIEYDINLQENKLAKGLKLNIYRIVQEQFNNIVKYAEASKVRVAINQKTNRLSLVIADNGKGFDLREKQKGIGLNNITSRAETYNGKVQIETSPGQGCKIQVEFFI